MNTFSQEPIKNNLPLGIKHYHKSDSDIVTWANKDLPKHVNFIVVFLVGLFALPVFCTWNFSQSSLDLFGWGILILIWLFFIFVAVVILYLPLFWIETIVISDRYIVFSQKGFGTRKEMRFKKENIIRISYERYDSFDGPESRYSLNIVYSYKLLGILPGREKVELAIFSRYKEKYQLFLYLQALLKTRGWPTLESKGN